MRSLPASLGRRQGSPEQLSLLYALADHVQRSRHLDVIFPDAVDRLCDAVGADAGALLVLDEGLLRIAASAGLSDACRAGVEGYAPWSADARDARSVPVDDVRSDPVVDSVRPTLLAERIETALCVPLLQRGRLIGEVLLFRHDAVPFEEADVRFAEAVAGHLAFGLWRTRSEADQAELLRRFEAERSVLESVVRQMPAGVMLADVPSGRIVMSNARAEELWGATLRETRRVADYARWGGLEDDGTPLAPEAWPLARSVLHGESVHGQDITLDRRGRRPVIVRMSSAPVLDARGRRLAAVATVDDVTAERTEETRQAFLQEATRQLTASLEMPATLAALAALVVGRYGEWCLIHQRSGDSLECVQAVHADPDMTEAVHRLAHSPAPIGPEHPIADVARTGRVRVTSGEREALRVLREGEPESVPAEMRSSTVAMVPLMARDRVLGVLSVGRTRGTFRPADVRLLEEVADRAGLAMDNAALYDQARSADREKSSFLAVMSHEFRTPLSAILGYADILTAAVHGELNARQRTHVERMKASVRHLSHLVDEILSFASMEAGRERIRLELVDVVALARDVAGIMEPMAEAAGLELRFSAAARRLETVTDPSKVRQILINLLSNGIKYTLAGHVELTVAADGELLRLIVRDTGPGIPDEHAEDAFEPFWQADDGAGRGVTGTGLGLSVARRLARLLGGDIRLVSTLGKGSEFVTELPLQKPDGVATGGDA